MGLFGALVRTAVNVATLPVAIAADVVTMGARKVCDDESFTEAHLKTIKREADEE